MPTDRAERDLIREAATTWVADRAVPPPVRLPSLRSAARQLLNRHILDLAYEDYAVVMLSNALWSSVVAEIPFERRVLMLPQCLRARDRCPAQVDEYGLLCERCGACPIGGLERKAEELGYVVLIAEGTTVVTSLLETGQVECVIGVSCLHTLERSFPYTESAAIPSLAIPLTVDGCEGTRVDEDLVRRAIGLRSSISRSRRLDLDDLRREVGTWFDRRSLDRELAAEATSTQQVACDWMVLGGKRWRPLLTAAVHTALGGDTATDVTIRRLATAVECFHKASLVHDDIEDDDDVRYGQPTVHRRYGVPIALNVGDLLVGEGYRLIAGSGLPPEDTVRALTIAAEGHRALCLGQGAELSWSREPSRLSLSDTMEIFRRKTSPSFEVALVLGAIAAGADAEVCGVLRHLSSVLGVAYQIRDDLEDLEAPDGTADAEAHRPTAILALAFERASRREKDQLLGALLEARYGEYAAFLRRVVRRHDLASAGWRLYDRLRDEALDSLGSILDVELKCLLHRVVHRVLPDAPLAADVRSTGPAVTRSSTATLPVLGLGVGKAASHGW